MKWLGSSNPQSAQQAMNEIVAFSSPLGWGEEKVWTCGITLRGAATEQDTSKGRAYGAASQHLTHQATMPADIQQKAL